MERIAREEEMGEKLKRKRKEADEISLGDMEAKKKSQSTVKAGAILGSWTPAMTSIRTTSAA